MSSVWMIAASSMRFAPSESAAPCVAAHEMEHLFVGDEAMPIEDWFDFSPAESMVSVRPPSV